MSSTRNLGRIAGLWYLALVILGPVRLEVIPNMLFVHGHPATTVHNIITHEWLFRFGMVADLAAAVVLIFLTLAFYRLFKDVDAYLAVLVVILGGVLPALIDFVNVANDMSALGAARGAEFLTAFNQSQQSALAVLFLRAHDNLVVAAELLWGLWLLPLGLLVYKSRFLPRFIGVWLVINCAAYVILCLIGILAPEYSDKAFFYAGPALFGELALMLWLVIRGAVPPPSGRPAFDGP